MKKPPRRAAEGGDFIDRDMSTGMSGPKGEPGLYGARTELDIVGHIIRELEESISSKEIIRMEDGHNHKRIVDGWALMQALDALKNYEALLSQPLFQLISPGVYHACHERKVVEGVR